MSLKSVINHYRPYFRTRLQKRNLILLVLGNVIQAVFIVITNSCFNHFFGLLMMGTFTPAALGMAVLQYLAAVFVYFVTAGLNSWTGDKIINALNQDVTVSHVNKWMDTKAYFGTKFLKEQKVINAAGTLSYDIQEANRLTVRLGDNLLNTFFAFLAGIYGLWQLSFPLTFTVASFAFIIPGYMVLGALLYAIISNVIVSRIGRRLRNLTEQQHRVFNKLEAQLHHVDKNAEGIELLRAQAREKQKINNIIEQSKIYNQLIAIANAGIAAFTALNEHLRFFVGIVLSIPQILAKKMSVDHLLTLGDYFTRVVSLFTWKHDNYEDVTNLEVLIGKLNNLQSQDTEWQNICLQNQLEITQGETLSFNELLISKSDDEILLNAQQFSFENAQIYLIQGPSGIGKSTLFRAMTKLWPYVKGKMTLPCPEQDIHIIPQQPVFPLRSTLYQAILYPAIAKQKTISATTLAQIDALLLEFQLSPSVIADRNKKCDWSLRLSGGERQRIALIRAIIRQPKLLMMDEPFSALDATLHAHCETALIKHLQAKKTTIILIDHRSEGQIVSTPQSPFNKVEFNNRSLVHCQELHKEQKGHAMKLRPRRQDLR